MPARARISAKMSIKRECGRTTAVKNAGGCTAYRKRRNAATRMAQIGQPHLHLRSTSTVRLTEEAEKMRNTKVAAQQSAMNIPVK
jgi:hypothetical protein